MYYVAEQLVDDRRRRLGDEAARERTVRQGGHAGDDRARLGIRRSLRRLGPGRPRTPASMLVTRTSSTGPGRRPLGHLIGSRR